MQLMKYVAEEDRVEAIEVAPVVHARWIDQIDNGAKMAACSNCGARNVVDPYVYKPYPWKYCYRCGAKMDLGNEQISMWEGV